MSSVPETISAAEAQRPLFAGVDVGGTNIKLGLVDDLGRTLVFDSIPTRDRLGPEDAVQRIARAVNGLLDRTQLPADALAAIGLGTPGTMDIPRGLILEPPNLPGWRHFPIRDRLSEVCGKPVEFENDANAAAYGEYWIGSGRAFASMIMLTLGTGVGGGIILNGWTLHGQNSFGAEFGHILIDSREDARKCVWGGGQGELEAYASASGVVARAADALADGAQSSLRKQLDAGKQLTTLLIAQEAEAGDAFALEVILETARYLGIGIVTLVHTIDPGAVIIGGAMNFGGHASPVGRRFLERIRAEFKRLAFNVVADTTVIDFATLGGDAGYIGAAGVARAAYLKHGAP